MSDLDLKKPDESVEVWISDVTNPTQYTKLQRWNSYNIVSDIMEPAHTFALDFAGDKAQRDQVANHGGQRALVFSHGALQIHGVVNERSDATNKQSTDNQITGRSTAGLLVDSAIPAADLGLQKLSLLRLAEKWIDPWMPNDVPSIVTNAAASRYVMAGGYVYGSIGFANVNNALSGLLLGNTFKLPTYRRKRYGKFGKASPYFAGTSADLLRTTRLEPGTKVWDGLRTMADQIGAHVWQSVDGSVIISRPAYGFDPSAYGGGLQLLWDKQADKASGGNIEEAKLETSIAERASELTIISAVKSDKARRGADLFHTGSIKDPGPAFWDDSLTTCRLHKPDLLPAKNLSDPAMVSRLARRRMCEAAIEGFSYSVLIAGHHAPSGALWAIDSMVNVEDQRNRISQPLYIKRVERRFDRQSGRTTLLELMPPDIWLGQFDDDSVPVSTFNSEMRKRIWW